MCTCTNKDEIIQSLVHLLEKSFSMGLLPCSSKSKTVKLSGQELHWLINKLPSKTALSQRDFRTVTCLEYL